MVTIKPTAMARVLRLRSAAILCVAMVMGSVAVPAAGQDAKAILVFHTYGQDTPGRLPFDTAFARTLRETTDVETDLYVETLDPNRFGGEPQARLTRAYLREKYAGKNIAAVAAVNDEALAFLLDERDPLFPGVPVAALLNRYRQSLPKGVAVIMIGNRIGESLSLGQRLNPQARQIVVIDGAPSGADRDDLHDEMLRQIDALRPRVPVISLHNLPLDELLARVEALSPDTIIFVARQYIGPRLKPIAQTDALKELARVARAPIYVGIDQMIGSGTLGGIVLSVDGVATQLAKLALEISKSGTLPIPPADSALVPMFDWRELRRWGISETLLPAGSIVLFRQPTAWDQYKVYIVGATVVVGLQSALIAGLVVQRARRRRTELALRESERGARETAERNQDLAGRLINAQEVERARIARDLHDDVSQQLAGVSIAFSGLKQRLGPYQIGDDLQQELAALQQQTLTLARGVRHLSHDLHPTVLQHLGLVRGLTSYCGELERAHGVAMTCTAEGDFRAMTPDAALCVYRIAQEALRNVIAHAGASRVDVQLLHAGDHAQITITDDGRGFDVHAPERSKGLGLVSMTERTKLAGGTISIESGLNQGTRVQATIRVSAPTPATDAAVDGQVA